jgi:pseudouridine synthase
VFELLSEPYRLWFCVGRLDKTSEGLLLFSDSSRLAQRLMDPGVVAKVYRVTVRGLPGDEELAALRSGGIEVAGRPARPAEVERTGKAPRGGTRLTVTLHEGRNREIHRLFEAVGFKVRRLVRVAVGSVELGELAPGQGRELPPEDVERLISVCVGGVSARSPDLLTCRGRL